MINADGTECQHFIVPAHYPSLWLAECLRRLGLSLSLRRRIKQTGCVRINGVLSPWTTLVAANSVLQVEWRVTSRILPQCLPLNCVYEDEWLLVVDKPAGMLVHPTSGQPDGTLANAVMHHYCQQGRQGVFHPVQRLDKNTSGLLVIAKTGAVQHSLSRQHMQRRYLAVASGLFEAASGSIDLPIARRPDSIILRMVSEAGQKAVTHYQVQESFADASLLQLELETGRTHQIRLHLSHIGHPLLGDELYGGETGLIARQALHCAFLAFTHPLTQMPVSLSAPLPRDLDRLLRHLGRRHFTAGSQPGKVD
ncbi:MAG: RluA family pseudouridine synthase [Sporomusaceae bacterium]|nr:RluA family pseudouridine synthase [Sporomusaceae bacterium]